MSLTVEAIEDLVMDALAADTQLAGLVRKFQVLPDLDPETLARVLRTYPALAVVATGSEWRQAATGQQDEVGQISVLCAHRNLRSPAAALRGVIPGETGVFDLVYHVRRVLSAARALDHDQVLDCLPRSWGLIRADGQLAVAVVELEVTWRHQL